MLLDPVEEEEEKLASEIEDVRKMHEHWVATREQTVRWLWWWRSLWLAAVKGFWGRIWAFGAAAAGMFLA